MGRNNVDVTQCKVENYSENVEAGNLSFLGCLICHTRCSINWCRDLKNKNKRVVQPRIITFSFELGIVAASPNIPLANELPQQYFPAV
jgi:hypothetical protein